MYYKQPRYYAGFHCIGGDCPNNCCYGWRIDWSKSEIDKVLNAENISPELRELVETSFVQSEKDNENYFIIEFRDNGKCPFQADDGLCKIQKELGAEYLSHTCTDYPRCHIYAINVIYRFCRMSCPAIMERFLNDETCMDMVSTRPMGETVIPMNNMYNIEEYPVQKYRAELFDFFYELIADKKYNVDSAIILGALAAKVLTKIEGREEYDSIPEQIKSLRKQMHNGSMLKSIDEIKPNPQIKFDFLPKITEQIAQRTTTIILHNSNGGLNVDLYNHGEERLREALNGREYFLRNIALSLLLEIDVPFKFCERTIFENYSLFVAAYACVKLNLIGAMAVDKSITMNTCNQQFRYEGDGKLISLTSMICRGLCQNRENSEKIIDLLKENGFDRPAYLALFIK